MIEIKERTGFVFYRSYFDIIEALPNDEQFAFTRAIINYGINKVEPSDEDLSAIGRVLWCAIKPTIAKGWRNFENGSKGAEFGKLGGAPEGNQNARKDKIGPNSEFDVSPHIADNTLSVRPQKISTTLQKNSPPTAEDVRTVIARKNGKFDYLIPYVDNFISYYTKQKWVLDSGEPMHDWWRTFQAFPYKQT